MVAFWVDEESHVRIEVPRRFADRADLCVIELVLNSQTCGRTTYHLHLCDRPPVWTPWREYRGVIGE